MKKLKWFILGAAALAFVAAVAAWRQLPQTVEMASYVPAETLVYLEAGDLPAAQRAITENEAWQDLSRAYNIETNANDYGWIGKTLARLNLGSTESIVFGRAQIAVALTGVGAHNADDAALRVKPQFAVVVETKSSRADDFVETTIQDFAKRQFGEIRVERKQADDAAWTIFRARTDARDLFAATSGTVAIVGNDQTAVQACLDAKNNKRKSLFENAEMLKARENTDGKTAFAFGFVTAEGVKQLSEIVAVFAAGQLAEDERAAGLLAQSLPPFVQKTVLSAAWTARSSDRQIEDRFLIELPADLTARLREPFAAGDIANANGAADVLPANIDSVSIYNFKNAQTAWRAAALAMIAKLDTVSAAVFSQTVNKLLQPYGVEKADEFLGATTGAIVTARITNDTIAFARVGDAAQLKAALQSEKAVDARAAQQTPNQNAPPSAKNVEAESSDVEANVAAEFFDNSVLLGSAKTLNASRAARESKRTLSAQLSWRDFVELRRDANAAFLRTLANNRANAAQFVKLFSSDKNTIAVPINGDSTSPRWAWAIGETKLVREGFERRTISAFGFAGTLATAFAQN